jgi:hypothetical protein
MFSFTLIGISLKTGMFDCRGIIIWMIPLQVFRRSLFDAEMPWFRMNRPARAILGERNNPDGV